MVSYNLKLIWNDTYIGLVVECNFDRKIYHSLGRGKQRKRQLWV